MENYACPICYSPLGENEYDLKLQPEGIYHISCPRCGDYSMTQDAGDRLGIQRDEVTTPKVANISGWIRTHPGRTIQRDDVQKLQNLPTPTPAAKAVTMLSHLETLHPIAGLVFRPILDSQIQPVLTAISTDNFENPALPVKVQAILPEILELIGICSISTHTEYQFVIRDVIEKEMGSLTKLRLAW